VAPLDFKSSMASDEGAGWVRFPHPPATPYFPHIACNFHTNPLTFLWGVANSAFLPFPRISRFFPCRHVNKHVNSQDGRAGELSYFF